MTSNLFNIVNGESISLEVAQEVLGQSLQPLRNALNAEKANDNPSPVLIAYYQQRMKALKDLQEDLPNRPEVIKQILDPDDKLFRL